MAAIQIDESVAKNQAAIIALVNDIQKDPALRKDFLQAVKKVRPDMPIPEIDAAAPIQAELAAIREEQKAFLQALKDEKAAALVAKQTDEFQDSWNKQKEQLRKRGYYDKAVETIDAFARQEGISSLLAAAAYYEQLNPPSLTATKSGRFDVFNDAESDDGKYLQQLMQNRARQGGQIDDSAVMHLAQNALNDIRSTNRGY